MPATQRDLDKFFQQIRADRPYYLAILLYLDVAICAVLFYDDNPAGPLQMIKDMLVSTVSTTVYMSLVWVGFRYLRAVRQGQSLRDVMIDAIDLPRFARFLMLPALFAGLTAFNAVKVILPEYTHQNYDRTLSNLDRAIHGTDPWRYFGFLYNPEIIDILQNFYLPFWTYALVTVTTYVLVSDRCSAFRDQFIIVFLLVWAFLGNVVAALFLSDGPAFYARVTGDVTRYGDLVEALAMTRESPFSAYVIQNSLWLLRQTHRATQGSGISAFPSLHVAMATLVCLALCHMKPRYAAYGVPYLMLIMLGSVVLGWHYAVDGYASVILVVSLWAMVANLRKAQAVFRVEGRSASAVQAALIWLRQSRLGAAVRR